MAIRRDQGERGLSSINQARAERRRAIVFGRARFKGMAPQFWLWTAVVLGGFFVVYWRVVQGQLESEKNQVMAKQRAIAKSLGPRILPFRDKLEGWVKELAGPFEPMVSPEVSLTDVSKSPGVYLRLRLRNAKESASIREAAARSLRDGFTSCLFVDKKAKDLAEGSACKTSADCRPGELCNEFHVCKAPPRPYNLRLAYRALRVLSTDWTDELHQASSELAVDAYDRDLDAVARTDVPVAIELLQRAQFFTVVIDEDPKGGLPNEIEDYDESDEERIQRVPHFARVGIWDLESGKPLLKLRARAEGKFVPVGKRAVSEPSSQAAQQRQANSCALALEVKQALAPPSDHAPDSDEAPAQEVPESDVSQRGAAKSDGAAEGVD